MCQQTMQFGLRASSFHPASGALAPQGSCLFAARQRDEVQALRARLQRAIAGTRLRMLGERCGRVQRLVAAEIHFRELLGLWRLDFACAAPRDLLRHELQAVFNALDAWRACYASLVRGRQGGAAFPGDLADARHYRDLLQMLALLRLFDLPAALEQLDRWLEDTPLDALMGALLRGHPSAREAAAPPAGYSLLVRALQAPRAAIAASWAGAYRLAGEGGTSPAEVCAGTAGCAFEALALTQLPMWQPGARAARAGRRRGLASRRVAAGVATALCMREQACALGESTAPVERGLASWYGPGFQDRPTANGERYDMFELSAAHKSLPLPSFVHVRNLRNGRQLVVVVNDRGPFVEGRVIDLSYAAARRLGMVEDGVAEVEIQPLSVEQAQALAAGDTMPPIARHEAREPRLPGFAGGLAALAGEAPAAAVASSTQTQVLQAAAQPLAELRAQALASADAETTAAPSPPAPRLLASSREVDQAAQLLRPFKPADAAASLPALLPIFAGGLLAWQQPDAAPPAVARAEPATPQLMHAALQWEAQPSDAGPQAEPVARAEVPSPGALPAFAGGLKAWADRTTSPAPRNTARPKPRTRHLPAAIELASSAARALPGKTQPARTPPAPLQARAPASTPGLAAHVMALAQRSWQGLTGWLGLRSTDQHTA